MSFQYLSGNLKNLVTTVELDERYVTKGDIIKAIVLELTKEGNQCDVIDKDTIVIDGCKFNVKERNYSDPMPIQQVILTKLK